MFISFIGGGLETDANLSASNTTLNPGDSATFTGTCPAPAMPPRDPNDTDAGYLQHNLGFNLGFGSYAARAFANAHGVRTDPAQAGAGVVIPWQFPDPQRHQVRAWRRVTPGRRLPFADPASERRYLHGGPLHGY